MYADDTALLFLSHKPKEMKRHFFAKLWFTWLIDNSLLTNLRTGRTEGTAIKLNSQAFYSVSIIGSHINNEAKFEYFEITQYLHLEQGSYRTWKTKKAGKVWQKSGKTWNIRGF